ncbi:T9SS type A sorting domain-containing protein [bacterium]|nr:T9SS type A sorting domain-containing protein [bacterium]
MNISGIAVGSEIAIYNIQGKMLLKQTFVGQSIPVGKLPQGFYLLKCDGYIPVKLLKK